MKSATTTAESTLEQLITEAQTLLTSGEKKAESEVSALHARLQKALEATRQGTEAAAKFAKKSAAQADEFVHERPYVTAGVAAALGLLVGFVVSRQCNSSAR